MADRTASDLFFRWFVVVYLPLGLLALMLGLLPFGMLPSWALPFMVLLGAYALPAVRLLIERRRSKLGVPLPRKIIVSVAVISGMMAGGAGLFVIGMSRLTTTAGLVMVFVGGCLMILSISAPAFRLMDIILRKTGRLLSTLLGAKKQTSSSPSTTPRRAEGSSRPGRQTTRPRKLNGRTGSSFGSKSTSRPRSSEFSPGPAPGLDRGKRRQSPLAAKLAEQADRLRAGSRPSHRRAKQGSLRRLAVPPPPPPES